MKSIKHISILILMGMIFAGIVYAEEPADKRWKDEAEFLYVQTGGNTDVLHPGFQKHAGIHSFPSPS